MSNDISRYFNTARLKNNLVNRSYMVPSATWMQRGFSRALETATWSKDPNRTVGAVVMNSRKRFFDGFNGFPEHIGDHAALLEDRDLKRSLMIHAEINSLNCAEHTVDSIMFVTGPCCHVCAAEIVNRGIIAVYALEKEPGDFPSYDESFRLARQTFALGGVLYREYSRTDLASLSFLDHERIMRELLI